MEKGKLHIYQTNTNNNESDKNLMTEEVKLFWNAIIMDIKFPNYSTN